MAPTGPMKFCVLSFDPPWLLMMGTHAGTSSGE
jgi:hypothetical protein